jgi:hypothetical protein
MRLCLPPTKRTVVLIPQPRTIDHQSIVVAVHRFQLIYELHKPRVSSHTIIVQYSTISHRSQLFLNINIMSPPSCPERVTVTKRKRHGGDWSEGLVLSNVTREDTPPAKRRRSARLRDREACKGSTSTASSDPSSNERDDATSDLNEMSDKPPSLQRRLKTTLDRRSSKIAGSATAQKGSHQSTSSDCSEGLGPNYLSADSSDNLDRLRARLSDNSGSSKYLSKVLCLS